MGNENIMSKLIITDNGKRLFEIKGHCVEFNIKNEEEIVQRSEEIVQRSEEIVQLNERIRICHIKNVEMASEINRLKSQIRANDLFTRFLTFLLLVVLSYKFY